MCRSALFDLLPIYKLPHDFTFPFAFMDVNVLQKKLTSILVENNIWETFKKTLEHLTNITVVIFNIISTEKQVENGIQFWDGKLKANCQHQVIM